MDRAPRMLAAVMLLVLGLALGSVVYKNVQAGHNFVIGSAEDLLGMIRAALLGHMGKHGPILLVGRDGVPQQVADFLRAVRPFPTAPQETILNFAWIIGDESRVSWETQKALHRLLAPRPMEGAHG